MHSNDQEAGGMKCCYFLFHSEVIFFYAFIVLRWATVTFWASYFLNLPISPSLATIPSGLHAKRGFVLSMIKPDGEFLTELFPSSFSWTYFLIETLSYFRPGVSIARKFGVQKSSSGVLLLFWYQGCSGVLLLFWYQGWLYLQILQQMRLIASSSRQSPWLGGTVH